MFGFQFGDFDVLTLLTTSLSDFFNRYSDDEKYVPKLVIYIHCTKYT